MRSNPARGSSVTLAVVLAVALTAPVTAQEGETGAGTSSSGVEVLERALTSSGGRSYRARAVVIGMEDSGPDITEMHLRVGRDGLLQVGSTESWMVTRAPQAGVYWSEEPSLLLALGAVDATHLSIDRLLKRYDVMSDGRADLVTGPALVLGLRPTGADHDRERLYVDEATDLVVRRETFDADGRPTRLIAFTSLDVVAEMPAVDGLPGSPATEHIVQAGGRSTMSPDSLEILDDTGWEVPAGLPGGFDLDTGYALSSEEGGALHLVYSDGLYTLSIYQQHGDLDPTSALGAVASTAGDGRVWRWPGADPERAIWSRDGLTYTAVSDAPADALLLALAGLPTETPPSLVQRTRSRAARVGRWLWPFG